MKKTLAAERKSPSIRSLRDCLRLAVVWHPTSDPLRPFRAEVGADKWRLRLDDFPAENLYTLLVNGREIGGFDDWPKSWRRSPSNRATNPSKRQSERILSPASARS
jgi:hypothetical protein